MKQANQSGRGGWQFWIDRGGTFTDVLGVCPRGRLHVRKVPSVAGAGGDAGLGAVRAILAAAGGDAPAAAIDIVKVGTTVATNALLTRSGEPVVLVTTAGFADGLRIGYQNRPDIFARDIVLPQALYREVIQARERIDAHGKVLIDLDLDQLRVDLERVRAGGRRAVAIVFMHAWAHPQHERLAARCARALGFAEVSVSHELSPLARYVTRADTTVLNAYLAPPLGAYVRGLQAQLRELDPGARLALMQSNGGLADPESFLPMSSVLSGPAGGLIGMQWVGRQLNLPRLIGFDMGGTSTDVSLIDGELPQRFEHLIGGVRLTQPMLDVHTIAAGGGSVLSLRDGRLAVGPQSAGADPGPACYGRGGPLTLTDVQVLLGHLRADTLPAVFGHDGRQRIDAAAVTGGFAALAAQVGAAGLTPEALAEAFLEVGVEAMANAIRQVATRQGLDTADFPSSASAARPASTPAASRVRPVRDRCWCIPWQACCRPSAWVSRTASPCAAPACGVNWTRGGLRPRTQRLPGWTWPRARSWRASVPAPKFPARCCWSCAPGTATSRCRWRARRWMSCAASSMPSTCRRFGFAAHSLSVRIEALRAEAALRLHRRCALSLPAAGARRRAAQRTRLVRRLARGAGGGAERPHRSDPRTCAHRRTPSTLVLEPGWTARLRAGGSVLLEDDGAAVAGAADGRPTRHASRSSITFSCTRRADGPVLKATASR